LNREPLTETSFWFPTFWTVQFGLNVYFKATNHKTRTCCGNSAHLNWLTALKIPSTTTNLKHWIATDRICKWKIMIIKKRYFILCSEAVRIVFFFIYSFIHLFLRLFVHLFIYFVTKRSMNDEYLLIKTRWIKTLNQSESRCHVNILRDYVVKISTGCIKHKTRAQKKNK